LNLLNTYAEYINPVEALKIVPENTPMAALSEYLTRIVPHTVHKRRHAQVVKSLSRLEHLQVG
jgi:hypothetical protein